MVAHIAAFAIGTPGGSWLVALVPQTSQVARLGYTVGVLSLYGAVVLGPSYYLRRRLGPRVWLVAHQFAALVYALALWHALALGPNVRADGPWRVALWVAQLPVAGAVRRPAVAAAPAGRPDGRPAAQPALRPAAVRRPAGRRDARVS